MVNLLTPGELERSRKVYQQLGLRDFAAPDEIKRAYRELALLHHPDKNPTDPDAINRFRLINEAYQILSDESKRKRYDSALQSAQATSSLYHNNGNGVGGNFPYSSARQAADNNNNHNNGMNGDVENHFQGSVPTPQQFRDQMNNIPKRRHPTSNGSMNTNQSSSPIPNSATNNSQQQQFGNNNNNNNNTFDYNNSSSSFDMLNEEYKRKEKARFAEMKKRLDNERAQQQEVEFQRLQKQQNDQRREQQRRQREQERIREKLDKALQQTPTTAADGTRQFQRIGSSQNQPGGGSSQFRASSNNNKPSATITNPKSINTPTYFTSTSSPIHPSSSAAGNNSATRARSANNNNNNSVPEYAFVTSHSHSKHTTFATSFGMRRSMSPLGSPVGNASARLSQNQKENAFSPPQHQHSSPSKLKFAGDGSPEMVAQARISIEKDIEVLPTEEREERDNFLSLQERHERALLMSRFKQEGSILETELLFRALFDEETSARFKVDCEEVVGRSAVNGWYQCVVEQESLLREASRVGHGLFAWHENIWQHMRQHLARRALIVERALLERSAVVEEQEGKEFSRLMMFGTTLHRKVHLSGIDEERTRSNLYLEFYNGAKSIEASRRFISQITLRMSKEESMARERLAVECEEMWRRGALADEYAQRCADTVMVRTSAISGYITMLQTTVAEMKEKVANHNAIVGGLHQAIEMHKRDNEREREEHETQNALMKGDVEGLESQVVKLRGELLTAGEKLIDENERYKRLEEDKKTLEKKLGDVRATVRLEHEAELKAAKEEAKNKVDWVKKEMDDEKEKYAALLEKFEKLRGKHTEAAEFLKEMVERDEKQKKVIEKLKNEVKMMRQLDDIENGGEGNSPDNNDNDDDDADAYVDEPDVTNNNTNNNNHDTSRSSLPSRTGTNAELDRSGSQISVFDVEKSQQQQLANFRTPSATSSASPIVVNTTGKLPSTTTTTTTTTTTGKPAATTTTTTIRRLNNNNNNNSSSVSSVTSPGLNQTPSTTPRNPVNGKKMMMSPTTPTPSSQQPQQQPQHLSPESTLANRHTRSVRLEHRLYTAAAAASAASVVLAQKESATTSIQRQRNAPIPDNNNNINTKTPPRAANTNNNNNSNNNNQQTPPTSSSTPPPKNLSNNNNNNANPVGRPPLSPSASSKTNPTSTTPPPPVGSNNNTTPSQQQPDPKISYRELSSQIRPKSLRQVMEWEEEDAIAVAQREAVTSFLQKQAGANNNNINTVSGFTDDPRQAPIHVRSPIPGKGILEYAGISSSTTNNNNNNQNSSSNAPVSESPAHTDSPCASCDMNKNAISKLVTTTDKLLLRNSGLVDDNETLAQAVVVMNAQREENARRLQQQNSEASNKKVVTILDPQAKKTTTTTTTTTIPPPQSK